MIVCFGSPRFLLLFFVDLRGNACNFVALLHTSWLGCRASQPYLYVEDWVGSLGLQSYEWMICGLGRGATVPMESIIVVGSNNLATQ